MCVRRRPDTILQEFKTCNGRVWEKKAVLFRKISSTTKNVAQSLNVKVSPPGARAHVVCAVSQRLNCNHISRAHRVTVARALTCYDIGLSWLGHWLHSWLWPLVLLCKAHCITAFVALPPPLKALNSPSIHVFGELLSLPSVQAVGLGFKRCGAMRVASWRRQFALTDTLDAL